MKILKIILIVILALAVLILIPPIFTAKTYSVEKEITINKNIHTVFDYLKLLKNQDNYSPWADMDPFMKKTFTGEDGIPGFISAWESDSAQVGKGEQEIIAINDGERIDLELRFLEPFVATDQAYLITEAQNDSVTTVKWGFNGKMNYPKNIFLLIMDMEQMLGEDLENGLVKLKGILETVDTQIEDKMEEPTN